MILVDSHCHLNFPDLQDNMPKVLANMKTNHIEYALAISVSQESFHEVLAIANQYPHIFATVGIHPDDKDVPDYTLAELLDFTLLPKVVGIGETGLDYHWCSGDLKWQHERFVRHIEASKQSGLPLVIHTRDAAVDTVGLLKETGADNGVIHCFTEDTAFAKQVLDLGFYVSFSGIVTFKNAKAIQDACRYVPSDRLLLETDSPYLAPVPFRGKPNEPAYVLHTATYVAQLREETLEDVAQYTTENFFRLFHKATR